VQVPPTVDRRAARVLLVDAADRVLLLRGTDPADASRGSWWFTPGGGLDDGETAAQAAVREVQEEVGLLLTGDLGPVVHERTTCFSLGGTSYRQAEVFFLARVERHEVDTAGFTPFEVQSVTGHRWWPREELAVTDEPVYPADLAEVLERALAGAA
jgi:8-oxo-dGTP pyrophosphatase MutT (NUDIX family)